MVYIASGYWAALYIYALIGIGTFKALLDFDKVSVWAIDSVTFALRNEMINTDADGAVNPVRNAKRD